MVDRHALVDERIGLLGDPHADLQWINLAVRNLARASIRQIHVLGDFGFLSNGSRHERERLGLLTEQLTSRNAFMYVTGGNHEGYPTLHRRYPLDEWGYRRLSRRIIWLPRGWRGVSAAGTVVASLGGANSVSRSRRDLSVSGHVAAWHPEEQISEADLEALGSDPVDVLLGHDAPFSRALQRHIARQRRFWKPDGIAYAAAGQAMFHRGVLQVRPKLVLSGHYHRYLDTTLRLQPREHATTTTARSVILDRNRTAHSVGILHVDALEVDVHPRLSPGLRRQHHETDTSIRSQAPHRLRPTPRPRAPVDLSAVVGKRGRSGHKVVPDQRWLLVPEQPGWRSITESRVVAAKPRLNRGRRVALVEQGRDLVRQPEPVDLCCRRRGRTVGPSRDDARGVRRSDEGHQPRSEQSAKRVDEFRDGHREGLLVCAKTRALHSTRLIGPEHASSYAHDERRNNRAELSTAQAQVALTTLALNATSHLFDALAASGVSTAKNLDRQCCNARTAASHNPWMFKASRRRLHGKKTCPKGIERRGAAPSEHYEQMSILTYAAAIPNHTAGSTPVWLSVLGVIFIVVVMVIVVLRRKRK